MRVDDRNLTGVPTTESGRTQDTGRINREDDVRPASGSEVGNTGDQVELSSTLGSLSRAISADDAGRQGKVEALAAQYRSGIYQPDAHAASKGLISEALAAGVR